MCMSSHSRHLHAVDTTTNWMHTSLKGPKWPSILYCRSRLYLSYRSDKGSFTCSRLKLMHACMMHMIVSMSVTCQCHHWQWVTLAGIPGPPAAIYHFLMDAAGEPCNHVVSSQKVWKTSLNACRRQVFRLHWRWSLSLCIILHVCRLAL